MFVLSGMCNGLFLTGITGLDWLIDWPMCDPFGVNVFMVVRSAEWVGMREYCSIPFHSYKKCSNTKQQTVPYVVDGATWQADICIAELCQADIRFKFFAALTSWLWLSENVKAKLCSTVILSLFSYGYETWSVAWREDHRQENFENKLPMNLFWPGGRRRRRLEKIACERLRESYF
jgi:hypothetical protein